MNIFSIRLHLVSTSFKNLLRQQMDLSTPLSSPYANMLPLVESEVEMYNLMHLFLKGGDKIEVFIKYSFISSKTL